MPTGLPKSGKPLTPREREVLYYVSHGMTYDAIGRTLYLAENSVKKHILRLRAKLDAVNRSHAVRRGFECGYLWLEQPRSRPADYVPTRGPSLPSGSTHTNSPS